MGAPFTDISLYTNIPYAVGTPEFYENSSIQNFVSDLYVQKMQGYKPPRTTRITIQTAYNGIWKQPFRNGSIVSIASYFSYEEYNVLDRIGKYKYILDVIQNSTISLCEEYGWDRAVFENVYNEVLACNFIFKFDYPDKKSRDKKKAAFLSVQKTETLTSAFINIQADNSKITRKLFDKKNIWWYDCIYKLARCTKWFDLDRFGVSYGNGLIEAWYSLETDEIVLFENGSRVSEIDFGKYFLFG